MYLEGNIWIQMKYRALRKPGKSMIKGIVKHEAL